MLGLVCNFLSFHCMIISSKHSSKRLLNWFFKLRLLPHLINFWLQSVFLFIGISEWSSHVKLHALHQKIWSVLQLFVTHLCHIFSYISIIQIHNEFYYLPVYHVLSSQCIIWNQTGMSMSKSYLSILESKLEHRCSTEYLQCNVEFQL